MLTAAGVLTWMHNSADNLKAKIENQTKSAAMGKGKKALFSLAFLAVFREGTELALFLLAVQQTSSPFQTLMGAVLGLAAVAVLGVFLFNSTRKLNIRSFFKVTSILLIVFAALKDWLLQIFCHRTGKRSRETPAPLYRLRIAISFLWCDTPPPFFSYL